MSRWNSSDILRYLNFIKILQVGWYLKLTVTLTLLYLIDWKLVDLSFFHIYKAKCARPKNRARLRGFVGPSVPDWHQVRNLSRPENVAQSSWLVFLSKLFTRLQVSMGIDVDLAIDALQLLRICLNATAYVNAAILRLENYI